MCLPPVVAHRCATVSLSQSSGLCALSLYTPETHVLNCRARPLLACVGLRQKHYKGPITCLFGGGKGEPEMNTDDSLWKSFEKAMGNLKKERTVEGMLREQLQKQELEGGDGGSGDFRSGRGDGSGDSEDEGSESLLEELIQVLLATAALALLYVYIIQGEELLRLFKDYIKYLFGATPSMRLKRTLNIWQRFFTSLVEKKEVVGREEIECTLEYLLFMTPTWWHHPRKYIQRTPTKTAPKTTNLDDWSVPAF